MRMARSNTASVAYSELLTRASDRGIDQLTRQHRQEVIRQHGTVWSNSDP